MPNLTATIFYIIIIFNDQIEALKFEPFCFHSLGMVVVKLLSRVQFLRPMDCRLPGSSSHGFLQAKILECVAISFSRVL